jgi:hypothetical protein
MQTGDVDVPPSSSLFQGLITQLSRFVDRDMLMRYHWGLGVGHVYSRIDESSQPIVAASEQLIDDHTGDLCSIQEPSSVTTGGLQTTSTALQNPEKELRQEPPSTKSGNSNAVPEARVQDTNQCASDTGGGPPGRKHDGIGGQESIGTEHRPQRSTERESQQRTSITTPEREDPGDRDAAPTENTDQFNLDIEDDRASIDLGEEELGGQEHEDLGFLDMYGADSDLDEELEQTCSYD